MLEDMKTYRCEINQDYRNAFCKSMFEANRQVFKPIAWHETKDAFEIFINDNSLLNKQLIDKFLELQKNSRKTIFFSFNKAIQLNDMLFVNNDESYVKLSYFNNEPLVCNLKPDDSVQLELVEAFDVGLIDNFKRCFINDNRLYENEPRMRPVYSSVIKEFDGLLEKNDFLFLRHQGEPVAFMAGMRLGKEIYCHTFYLVTITWIKSSLEKSVKHEIVLRMMQWLNKKRGPFAAGINYSNKPSTNFALKAGFKPYFLRFVPWPS